MQWSLVQVPALDLTLVLHYLWIPSLSQRQRSFNRQSTAFVMRGLWVRFPPLALQMWIPLFLLYQLFFAIYVVREYRECH